MKRVALLFVVVALLWFLPAGGDTAEEARTLKGEFAWNSRTTGDLEAVFTATGDGAWDVDFHFTFRGSPHVYSGTAEGSLSEGALEGKVRNESRKRTFVFSGKFEDGTFHGTHSEVTGGGSQDTGTLTLGG